MSSLTSFETLPVDVIPQIFQFAYFTSHDLPLKDIQSMALVSTKTKKIVDECFNEKLLNGRESLKGKLQKIKNSLEDKVKKSIFFMPGNEEEQKLWSDYCSINKKIKKLDNQSISTNELKVSNYQRAHRQLNQQQLEMRGIEHFTY